MKTTMKNFLQKITKFKIQELKIVRENAKEIKIIKFSFLGLAIVSLLALGGYHYYNATKITPHNEVAIQYKAKLLLDHIKNNTVLKDVNYQYSLSAQTAFQTNIFVDRSKAGLTSINFFTDVHKNKLPDSELLQHLQTVIRPKVTDNTLLAWESLEEADLLKTFVRLEYYRCKVISIEDNFSVNILSKYIDSTGTPILPPYHSQKEYDRVSEQWLKTVSTLINEHNDKLTTINTVLKALDIAYKTDAFKVNFENNTKSEILYLRKYADDYFPKLIKLSGNVIGLDVPMAAN